MHISEKFLSFQKYASMQDDGLTLSSGDMMKLLRILRQFSIIRIPLYNSSLEGRIFLKSFSVFKNMHPCKIMGLTLSSGDVMKLLRILRHFSIICIPLYNSSLEGCTFLRSFSVFKIMHVIFIAFPTT